MPQFVSATRVQLICPCGSAVLYRATKAIIDILLADNRVRSWGGFTYSSLDPPVFTGWYWNDEGKDPDEAEWENDQNVLIVIDAPNESADTLLLDLDHLRVVVNRIYVEAGHPQMELWITTQPLQIFV